MKKAFYYWFVVSTLTAMAIFVSCEKTTIEDNDDNGDNTEQTGPNESDNQDYLDLPYAQHAVLFEMTDDSDIECIELLADGSYVVMTGYNFQIATTQNDGSAYFGFYKPLADGAFELGEFGNIKQIGNDKLDITRNGTTKTYNVTVTVPRKTTSDSKFLDEKLIGKWQTVEFTIYSDGVRTTYTGKELEGQVIKYAIYGSTPNDDNYYPYYRYDNDNNNNKFERDGFWYWSNPSKYELSNILLYDGKYVANDIFTVSFEDDYKTMIQYEGSEKRNYTIKFIKETK